MQPIHIFKAGKHTSAGGSTLDFSEDVLRAAAAAYDPAVHEAPIVVGHPKDNGPAYGWISSLSYSEDGLFAAPAQLEEQFAENVKAGRFKKVSASFYTPEAPNNPAPGVYYLRHVGFLGAQPPAIKGLKAVNFAEAEEGVVEFGDWEMASFLRRFREWFIDKFSREEADAVVPSYLVENIEAAARAPLPDAPVEGALTNYQESTSMTPEEITALQARVTAAEAEAATLREQSASFAEQQAALATERAALARAALERSVDDLVAAGKALPAERDGLIAYLESVPAETVVSFGEGDAATTTPSRTYLLEMLGKRPALVEFGEIANPTGGGKAGSLSAEQVAAKAVEFQEAEAAAGRTISTTAAVAAVIAGTAGAK